MLFYCYGSVSDHFGPSALINLDLDLDITNRGGATLTGAAAAAVRATTGTCCTLRRLLG